MADKDLVYYIDTDSVDGSSAIRTNIGEFKIEDLWKMSDEKHYHNGKFIGILPGMKTFSFNKEKGIIEERNINFIMKHKVRKKMYRIKSNGKYVDITEDHSIDVDRNGDIISISPKNLLKSDKIISIMIETE